MNFTKSEHFFKSSNGVDNIAYYIYTPKGKARAVIQLCHGMCEYIGRYEHFIDHLCSMGFAVIGNDHLGHGNSAADSDDLGYFALEYGWIYLIKDVRRLQLIGKSLFGGIPYCFIGHSMGSLILRCFLAKYSDEADGAVILGTVGVHPGIDAGIILAESEMALHGVKSRSKKMNHFFFGLSNIRIEDKRTEFDWISRDEQVVADYIADKKCNFVFTASAFKDLFFLLDFCSKRSWYSKVRKDIPVLLMAGTEDPIGIYGKGVMHIYRQMIRHGFENAEIKLWDGGRHEILNETNRMEVYAEIVRWLNDEICPEK